MTPDPTTSPRPSNVRIYERPSALQRLLPAVFISLTLSILGTVIVLIRFFNF